MKKTILSLICLTALLTFSTNGAEHLDQRTINQNSMKWREIPVKVHIFAEEATFNISLLRHSDDEEAELLTPDEVVMIDAYKYQRPGFEQAGDPEAGSGYFAPKKTAVKLEYTPEGALNGEWQFCSKDEGQIKHKEREEFMKFVPHEGTYENFYDTEIYSSAMKGPEGFEFGGPQQKAYHFCFRDDNPAPLYFYVNAQIKDKEPAEKDWIYFQFRQGDVVIRADGGKTTVTIENDPRPQSKTKLQKPNDWFRM